MNTSTTAGQPQEQVSPGRAAYEARLAAKGARLGIELTADWAALRKGAQADWEAGANAAIEAGPAAPQRLAAGNTRLREQLDQAAGQLVEARGHAAVLQEQLDEEHRTRQHLAGEREEALSDLRRMHALVGEIVGEFSASKGDGYRARVGQVKMAEWGARAKRIARRVTGEAGPQRRPDGADIIDIGPECFAGPDATVICWRGVNYYCTSDDMAETASRAAAEGVTGMQWDNLGSADR